jgi:hypothetical protein
MEELLLLKPDYPDCGRTNYPARSLIQAIFCMLATPHLCRFIMSPDFYCHAFESQRFSLSGPSCVDTGAWVLQVPTG